MISAHCCQQQNDSANSKDWPVVDLAIMLSGDVSVPIYPAQNIESAHYIFRHSEAKRVFAGSLDQAARVRESLVQGMETVAMLGCTIDCDTTLSETGKAMDRETVMAELENLLDEINAEVPPYEMIGQVYVTTEWTIESTLLTPTMKLKRNRIEQVYREKIHLIPSSEHVCFL